jgi:phage tail-like protein
MKARAIKTLLPGVFEEAATEGSALDGLLQAMEALHEPSEQLLDRLDLHFDPRRAPASFVPFLARWVDIDYEVTTGLGRLRELTACAVALSKMRGTGRGLVEFLRAATGVAGFEVDEAVPGPSGEIRQCHILVRAPAATKGHEEMIRSIVEREKPAHVTWELAFTDAGAEPKGPRVKESGARP